MSDVRVTIHRSASEIGGNCIEITTEDGARLILDVGRPLDVPEGLEPHLPASLDLSKPVEGVLLSHPHQDHYGLLQQLPASWPVFSGEAGAKLIRLTSEIIHEPITRSISTWLSGSSFPAGPFRITPLLTDHSAFDAYMIQIEVAGKKILYSGDFRAHGRKKALVERLMVSPPENLDALIMEGTNLGSDKPCTSESTLEEQFVDLFQKTTGRVFVAWSAQNIDRTVSLYRACKKTGRTLVVDLYTAEVLEMLREHAKIPQPGWPNLKVVITSKLSDFYRRKGREDVTQRMVAHGISAKKLVETPRRWVVMTRESLLGDYERKGVTPNASDVWVWSMWRGYLKKTPGQEVKAWFDSFGAPYVHLHTSGHASTADLKEFAQKMNPKVLLPVHGTAWTHGMDGFPRIAKLEDGQAFSI